MLYTGKGDNGTTKTFGCCDQRISKSSVVAEALGCLDEVNSFLGIVKMRAMESTIRAHDRLIADIVAETQHNLFTVQAEVAGADKRVGEDVVRECEAVIGAVEAELPLITCFFVSGGTELAASLDFARTLARRAERRTVAVAEEGVQAIDPHTLAYLNRLSSLLYALARQVNCKSGITEEPPKYR